MPVVMIVHKAKHVLQQQHPAVVLRQQCFQKLNKFDTLQEHLNNNNQITMKKCKEGSPN